jgi:DNA invertase Pin-like site-specific DNA recombinase
MVAYLRVSRKSQAESGLGIEAQRATVATYVAAAGCELLAEYVEVETGKKHDLDNRPELRRAVAHARRSKAVLVVAKLDRLLRSTVICNMLKTSGISFVACDNPAADEFHIDILAAVAANEVRQISKRTKDALKALKMRGVLRGVLLGASRPGAPRLLPEARKRGAALGAKAVSERARDAYSDLSPGIADMAASGLSLRAIASRLNSEGHTTRTGRAWNPVQISRVLSAAQRTEARLP